ncbi:MAG: ABC transporter ATP-binding protein [Bacteroidales bacterium]|jgi:ABC-type polysaccharide/polyol phosphate transport system ATPase subunit|nr:ABC transporter ATP-binding protein [Bacteroidales bacterium]
MNNDIAIKVDHISKTFEIPQERRNSIRERMLEFRKKTIYEKYNALEDVSMEIRRGEFFGIIGRNGSGKSTFLKILAGIYTPDSGSVAVNGQISPFLELGVGFNPELSGKDNIFLNGTILGLTFKEIERKYHKIIEFSELERFIHLKVKNYSSGMQVRLAFSVAIYANKEILLMDEVLAVGDSNFQSKCLTEFLNFKRQNKTIVLVTHDLGVARKYCDRLMLLRSGKDVMTGGAREVAAEYTLQNMSDEERRIYQKAQQKNAEEVVVNDIHLEPIFIEKNPVNKAATIEKIEFLDENKNLKNIFKTGEDLVVRIWFSKHESVDKLNFGIAIYSLEDYYIFGINTLLDHISTEKYLQKGYCDVHYRRINLGTNKYYIRAGIYEDQSEKLIDYVDQSPEYFQVQAFNQNTGIIHLDYEWV